MSWVFIDSSARGVLRLALMPARGRIRSRTIRRTRIHVPSALASFVSVDALRHAEGVCVVAGPGSFSAIRAGVLVANVMARALGKPLAGVSVAQAAHLSVLRDALAHGAIASSAYVAPVYDQEPNITHASATC
jgi:tRNA A37 threonylcarbamoyladenosine modification protein TsaB